MPVRFIFQVTAVLKYLYSHTTDGPNYLDPFQFAEKGVTVYSYLASITVLSDTKMIFSYAPALTKIIIPLIFVVCFNTFMAVVMNSIRQVFGACIPEGSLKARLGHLIFHWRRLDTLVVEYKESLLRNSHMMLRQLRKSAAEWILAE